MANIDILKPSDQPLGVNRLLWELETNLQDPEFKSFKFIVAFAKLSPFLKLYPLISSWKDQGKSIEAVFGVDQNGTSKEALEIAIINFDSSHIVHMLGKFTPTFHPKIYLFEGNNKAVAYIGSNNFTVGGTETNFESYLKIEMTLPQDSSSFNNISASWTDSVSISKKLTKKFLKKLVSNKIVIDEKSMRFKAKSKIKKKFQKSSISSVNMNVMPARAIPKSVVAIKKGKPKKVGSSKKSLINVVQSVPFSVLVMHIIPHHNGEILLSKLAVNQNQVFFDWPFTGSTVPKKATNSSYPQRDPDPKVDILLFDTTGSLVFRELKYNLNTVYYEPKSEIRITVPSSVITLTKPHLAGPYPILVMKGDIQNKKLDYEIEIYLPGSTQYSAYDKVCNQQMPSGGKPIARKFGWL